MKYERISSNLLFYVDRLCPLVETIDVLSKACDLAGAFQIPVELLRDTVAGLADFHTTLRNEHELEVSGE